VAINNFIPTVWAGGIMRELERNQTWTQAGVVNRDYEGQIRQKGDTVQINQLGDVSIFDYVKNTDLPDPEVLDDSMKTMVIDQQKAFHFYVDDIDQVQSSEPLIGEATRKAGRGLNEVAGSFVGNLALGADTQNVLGSASSPITTIDKQNVYDFLVEMAKRLNDAGVPKEGRWLQAPSWLESIMLTAKILSDVDPQGVIRNANIGKVATFNIISAPVVPTATDATAGDSDVIVAGHAMGISFAEQIVDTKAYEPEKRFGDAVKGLHVYGGKLIRPEALSIAYAKGSSGTFAGV
jgi:hypothetical protein